MTEVSRLHFALEQAIAELERERAVNAGLRQRIRELTANADERRAARVWVDSGLGPVLDVAIDGPAAA